MRIMEIVFIGEEVLVLTAKRELEPYRTDKIKLLFIFSCTRLGKYTPAE